MYSLEKGIFSNLFMVESVFEDLHPLYMRTADYIDQVAGFIMRSGDMGDIEVDVDDYVNAEAIHEYRRILTGAVESGRVKLNRSTEKVPHPEAATVTSCWLKRLEPSRMEKGRKGLFWLDAVMVAEIDIVQSENSCTDAMRKCMVPYRKLAESGTALRRDHVRQWFRLRGYMDLMGRRSELVQSIMIYDKRDRRPDKPYTKSLRPIFRKSEMNCEGERILKKHRLWEKAVKRGYVDAFELADKMGLTPVPVRLSRNYLIRAELFLHNAVVRVYKPDGTDEYIDVKAGTILYDPVACGSEEGVSESIIHECVHNEEHDLYYILRRKYNDGKEFLGFMDARFRSEEPEDAYEQWLEDESCWDPDMEEDDSRRTDIDWVEWQTRELTPCVKMPETIARRKIEELKKKYAAYSMYGMGEVYARVIPELAAAMKVTPAMAKIRLIGLGYSEARGAMNYMDGKLIPAYTTRGGWFKDGVTYDISTKDAARFYRGDGEFRDAVSSGSYVFVENHFCFNSPEFIETRNGNRQLTAEARKKIDACSIAFHFRYISRSQKHDGSTPHSDLSRDGKYLEKMAGIPVNDFDAHRGYVNQSLAEVRKLSFAAAAWHYMDESELSQEKMAEILHVSTTTVKRTLRGERIPTREEVICFCLALRLDGMLTRNLLSKLHYMIGYDSDEEVELAYVVDVLFAKGLEECNEYYTGLGYGPLLKPEKENITEGNSKRIAS